MLNTQCPNCRRPVPPELTVCPSCGLSLDRQQNTAIKWQASEISLKRVLVVIQGAFSSLPHRALSVALGISTLIVLMYLFGWAGLVIRACLYVLGFAALCAALTFGYMTFEEAAASGHWAIALRKRWLALAVCVPLAIIAP